MALGFKKPIPADDPRLEGHETFYLASRGGHFPAPQKATPGARQEDEHTVTLERLDK